MDYFGCSLFFLEFYHLLTHFMVLFRIRMLPTRDLARLGLYFLIDTLTVATSSFVYTRELRWLATLQIVQHMFFFLNWNKHPYAIKVMQWSSLDWLGSENHGRWHWDIVLGTSFDTFVHLCFIVLILKHITMAQAAASGAAAVVVLGVVVFNGRFAWSTPGHSVRPWVKRRISTALPDYSAVQG